MRSGVRASSPIVIWRLYGGNSQSLGSESAAGVAGDESDLLSAELGQLPTGVKYLLVCVTGSVARACVDWNFDGKDIADPAGSAAGAEEPLQRREKVPSPLGELVPASVLFDVDFLNHTQRDDETDCGNSKEHRPRDLLDRLVVHENVGVEHDEVPATVPQSSQTTVEIVEERAKPVDLTADFGVDQLPCPGIAHKSRIGLDGTDPPVVGCEQVRHRFGIVGEAAKDVLDLLDPSEVSVTDHYDF